MTRFTRPLVAAAALAVAGFSSQIFAGCGAAEAPPGASAAPPSASTAGFGMLQTGYATPVSDRDYSNLPIVGLWKFVQTLPNGTIFDSGFSAWHSDRTEIMNSAKPPITGNFCMGVWKPLGNLGYRLNHFALGWSSDGQNLIGIANIKEDVTLDSTGNAFSGTWSINQMDGAGNSVFSAAGTIVATRVTVD